jgi:hypothetical protein
MSRLGTALAVVWVIATILIIITLTAGLLWVVLEALGARVPFSFCAAVSVAGAWTWGWAKTPGRQVTAYQAAHHAVLMAVALGGVFVLWQLWVLWPLAAVLVVTHSAALAVGLLVVPGLVRNVWRRVVAHDRRRDRYLVHLEARVADLAADGDRARLGWALALGQRHAAEAAAARAHQETRIVAALHTSGRSS